MKIENKIVNCDYRIGILSDEKACQAWGKYVIDDLQKVVHEMLSGFLSCYLKYGQRNDEPIRFMASLVLGHIAEFNDIEDETTG